MLYIDVYIHIYIYYIIKGSLKRLLGFTQGVLTGLT